MAEYWNMRLGKFIYINGSLLNQSEPMLPEVTTIDFGIDITGLSRRIHNSLELVRQIKVQDLALLCFRHASSSSSSSSIPWTDSWRSLPMAYKYTPEHVCRATHIPLRRKDCRLLVWKWYPATCSHTHPQLKKPSLDTSQFLTTTYFLPHVEDRGRCGPSRYVL